MTRTRISIGECNVASVGRISQVCAVVDCLQLHVTLDVPRQQEELRLLPKLEQSVEMAGVCVRPGETDLAGADVERRQLAVTRRLDFNESISAVDFDADFDPRIHLVTLMGDNIPIALDDSPSTAVAGVPIEPA